VATGKEATNAHPYLKSKGVHAYGLRLLSDALLVPLFDTAEIIHECSSSMPNGDKMFKTGTVSWGTTSPLASR